MKVKKRGIFQLVLCSFFAALTAVLSQIVIPIGAVPINLATFSVFCSGVLLGWKYGALSQIVYVLTGAVGVPVFSMLRGGIGVLFGPTGGYIFGYILASAIIGFMVEILGNKTIPLIISMLSGMVIFLSAGTVWFMFITGSGLLPALAACVFPFLPGDMIKIFLAVLVTSKLKPVFNKYHNGKITGDK